MSDEENDNLSQWDTFRQYELQQRQQELARSQQRSEERARKFEDLKADSVSREELRKQMEKNRELLREFAVQTSDLKRQQSAQDREIYLRQMADELQAVNEKNYEAQQIADQKHQERQRTKEKTWVSGDGRTFRSPLERDFWDAWISDSHRAIELPLIPQHRIGKYFADFAHVASKTVIELDGRAYHSDRYAFVRDRIRHRFLEKQGWHVVRFASTEIQTDVSRCVSETYEIIRGR